MKLSLGKTLGRFLGLIIVTVFAIFVMIKSGGKSINENGPITKDESEQEVNTTLSPVQAIEIQIEELEVFDKYAGIIEPFERYIVSLEVAGRIESLGVNSHGDSLDIGDEVEKGQELAYLDKTILQAQRDQTEAQRLQAKAQLEQAKSQYKQQLANLEKAQSDYNRMAEIKTRSPGAVTDTVYQEAVTAQKLAEAAVLIANEKITIDEKNLNVAEAMLAIAEKNLADAIVKSPVNGVIAKRMVNPGESVNLRQQIFEIVEVDRVLLTVGVPESRIAEIQDRFNKVTSVKRAIQTAPTQVSTEDYNDSKFTVHVEALGKDRYGKVRDMVDGEVYRIAETANERNSLFHVQILLQNKDRLLKPGRVAMASLVIDTIQGHRLPIESVIFRDGGAHIFTIKEQSLSEVELLNWNIETLPRYVATKINLEQYTQQGNTILVKKMNQESDLPASVVTIVRGQNQLTDGKSIVQLMPINGDNASEGDDTKTIITDAAQPNLDDQSRR